MSRVHHLRQLGLDDWLNARGDPLRFSGLATRMRWFRALRWVWTMACLMAATIVIGLRFPAGVDYRLLLLAAGLLALTNGVIAQPAEGSEDDAQRLRRTILLQTGADYVVLALVNYALGGYQSPVLLLFLAEISLVTLLCQRYTSLGIALLGTVCALLPMWLEYLGWLPPVSLYGIDKSAMVNNGAFVTGYSLFTLLFVLFFWYVVSEITASLQQREENLEQACGKIHELYNEKVQAMLHTAHELKAPLAIIKNYVYTLRDGYCGELPDKARQVVTRIGERSDLLMAKVVDIIHLSNLRTLVQPERDLHAVDLQRLLQTEVEEARQLARARDIEVVDATGAGEGSRVRGSEEHLRTLISNLLANAVQYSHDGGRVEVALQTERDRLILFVRDQGIGIAADKQVHIFEAHYRTREAVAHYALGTGLGLPMVEEIARIHHAEVRLKSAPGKGTEVSVNFPLIPDGETTHGQDSDH